jgi:hypothetical protein
MLDVQLATALAGKAFDGAEKESGELPSRKTGCHIFALRFAAGP